MFQIRKLDKCVAYTSHLVLIGYVDILEATIYQQRPEHAAQRCLRAG